MGINVEDGFIYFNEMLYRIMRAQFVTALGMKLNKVMTVTELVTQYKIAELTLNEASQSKVNKSQREEFLFKQLSTQPMNLFLTKMFFKTSFKTWKNYMEFYLRRLQWDKQQEKKLKMQEALGKDYTKLDFPKEDEKMEQVEIERELLLEISCSSDEGDITDNMTHKSLKSAHT